MGDHVVRNVDEKLKVTCGKEKQFPELQSWDIQEIKAAITLMHFLSKLLKIPFSNSKVTSLELSGEIILKSTRVWKERIEFCEAFPCVLSISGYVYIHC